MLAFKKDILEKIISHVKREYPNEGCGILAGTEAAEKIYEMANTQKSPEFYLMDAAGQLRVLKDIRNTGLKMLAIYHSHVASPAYPSNQDVEMAFYPESSYVIISLKDMEKPEVKSFKINEGKILEEQIKII